LSIEPPQGVLIILVFNIIKDIAGSSKEFYGCRCRQCKLEIATYGFTD
jgi:hypothetical protein